MKKDLNQKKTKKKLQRTDKNNRIKITGEKERKV